MQHPDSVRRQLAYAVVALLAASILIGAGVAGIERAAGLEPLAQREIAVTPTPGGHRGVAPEATTTPDQPVAVTAPAETAQMAALAAGLPPGSVSVAVRDLTTGATFTYGSSSGQTTASLVKVDILAALLLQQQASAQDLTDDEDSEAATMIEDSDDDAASDLWNDIGGGSALAAANRRLGVRCTVPGPGLEWGLTTTCAQGQVQLLYQLENPRSPLDQSSRAYVLNLMDNVAESQSWGVPVVADPGTEFAVKDGWLNLDGDTDWAVTSDGIVVYHGQTLLIAALTQNNDTVYAGVELVQQLAELAAQSVAT